jgi:hypothetical protein
MTTDFEKLEEEYTRFVYETAIMKSFTNGLKMALKMKPIQIKNMILFNTMKISEREQMIREKSNVEDIHKYN